MSFFPQRFWDVVGWLREPVVWTVAGAFTAEARMVARARDTRKAPSVGEHMGVIPVHAPAANEGLQMLHFLFLYIYYCY